MQVDRSEEASDRGPDDEAQADGRADQPEDGRARFSGGVTSAM